MPAACSLVVWVVLLGLVIWVGYGLAVVANLVLPRRVRLSWWTIGLGIPGIVIFSLVGLILYTNRPTAVFHDVFGEWPTSDVNIESSHRFVFGDSGEINLTFTADPATVQRLGNRIANTPAGGPATHWTSPAPRLGFGSEQEVLDYSPAVRRATYAWSGVD